VRTCEYKDKECPYYYGVDKCTKYQDCQHDEIELERLREENEKLKEQLKASHFSKVIGQSCNRCNGDGYLFLREGKKKKCPKCYGSGKIDA